MTGLLRWSALLTIFALAGPARADEEWDKLKASYEQAVDEWSAAYSKARAESQPITPPHPAAEYMPRLKAYAEQHASDSDGLAAMIYIIREGQPAEGKDADPIVLWAIQTLREKHAASPDIAEPMRRLRGAYMVTGEKPLQEFYAAVIEKNASPDAKAAAHVALGMMNWELAAWSSPDEMNDTERAERRKRAEQQFRLVAKQYPDAPAATRAKGFIFELDHLQVGMKAPEIVGRDAKDQEIRLSQFAGQVVVLDFWGFW